MYGRSLPKADKDTPKTWPEWTDPCGHVYRPGDYCAVAVINGRSPQLVIGKVVKINRVNSKKEQIGQITSDNGDPALYALWRNEADQSERHRLHREWQASRVEKFVPSCTVTMTPAIDGRGFGRGYGDEPIKNVTYQFPGNIVKVDISPMLDGTRADLEALAKELGE